MPVYRKVHLFATTIERLEGKAVEMINFSTAVKNIINNFWLLFSTVAVLCLFFVAVAYFTNSYSRYICVCCGSCCI